MRAAFGSGRGNARLATLGNAIKGRNVTAHSTVNTNSTKALFAWQELAATRSSEAMHDARSNMKRRTAPAAQPRGRLRR